MTRLSASEQVEFGGRLIWLGSFAAFGVVTSAVYLATGRGVPCPFRSVTGWDCPLCGGTRLGAALLQLHPIAAFRENPLVFVGLVVLALLGTGWSVAALGGPRVRPPVAVGRFLAAMTPTRWTLAGLVIVVLWTLVRNLLLSA